MANTVFRQESIKRVSSPEQLNDYVKVSTPGIWMVLIGVAALLIGICVWGIFGHLNTVVETDGMCENGVLTYYLSEDNAAKLKVGDEIRVSGVSYGIRSIGKPQMREGVSVCAMSSLTDLPDGGYTVSVTVERVKPMSFVTN